MSRETLIDAIRRELLRQHNGGSISAVKGEVPDTFHVIGVLDIHRLAEAICDRVTPW